MAPLPLSPHERLTHHATLMRVAGKRFFDFDQMRQEILQETERITGANKGISDKAIRLKICSPHVL